MDKVVKESVLKVLQNSSTGLTIEEIWRMISGGYTTVARALRKLREEGKAVAIKVPGDRTGKKQWAAAANVGTVTSANIVSSSFNSIPLTSLTQSKSASALALSKPSLVRAVTAVIRNDMPKGFSAYDVTIKLREKVANQGSYVDPVEVGTVYSGGRTVPKIEHNDVKAIINELFESGLMSGRNRVFNGTYVEYVPNSL